MRPAGESGGGCCRMLGLNSQRGWIEVVGCGGARQWGWAGRMVMVRLMLVVLLFIFRQSRTANWMFTFPQRILIRSRHIQRGSIWPGSLLKRMHKWTRPRATAWCRSWKLGSAAGRAIVVSPLPTCVDKGDIVGRPRRPKIIYPQAIILFVSRPIQIQGVLFAGGEFAKNWLHHLPPRFRYLPSIMMIARHISVCFDFSLPFLCFSASLLAYSYLGFASLSTLYSGVEGQCLALLCFFFVLLFATTPFCPPPITSWALRCQAIQEEMEEFCSGMSHNSVVCEDDADAEKEVMDE